jgi:hypothetical protein
VDASRVKLGMEALDKSIASDGNSDGEELGTGGCGWAVALGGMPWCLYGKAGGLTHTRVIVLIAGASRARGF